jgi:hypothetical protein
MRHNYPERYAVAVHHIVACTYSSHLQGEELIPSGGGGGKLKSTKLANSLIPFSAPFDIV